MAILTPRVDDQSSVDYDSSSSSVTVPGSSRSWMSSSNPSFGSRRSSISEAAASSFSASSSFSAPHKPHKSNQAAWQAIRRLQAARGRVGLDQFRLLRRVGSGDIGNVYLCQIRNPMVGLPQCFYAMKVVDREALAIRNKEVRADVEKEILGMLDHPFLPTLYAEFEASHYSCLVMEYCPGGDLYAARQRQPGRRFSITSAKFYAAEVLLALEYLHMMGIVYRDLKPENVLVREDGHIMLSDFDLSLKCDVVPELLRTKTISSTTTYSETITSTSTHLDHHRDNHKDEEEEEEGRRTCFTPTCSTPIRPVLSCLRRRPRSNGSVVKIIRERADGGPTTPTTTSTPRTSTTTTNQYDTEMVAEPTNARSKSFVGTHEYLAPEVISGQGHGSAVDWWTLGVFLYEMLYGRTPFKGENNERTLVNILKQPLTFPRIGVGSSKEFEDLVRVQDLISRLLVKNPKRRIGSLKGSVEIKRHDFFRDVNWALIRSVRPPEVPNDHYNLKFRTGGDANHIPKLTKKERQEPYQIPPRHFDYF